MSRQGEIVHAPDAALKSVVAALTPSLLIRLRWADPAPENEQKNGTI